ncbi:MAG TPA: hypothetical protein VHT96_01535 [Clostridia bacterium]|nr:hypothetical protein [Clostridia bacterium]
MKRNVFVLLIIILLFATQTYSFGTDIDTLNLTRIEKEHQTISSAVCISANSRGDIALGFNDDYINVYDSNGKFVCSYSFNVNSSYFFEIDDMDGIMIFSLRGNKSYYYNKEAELLKTKKFNNIDESGNYFEEHEGIKKISVNKNTYELSQRWGYTKLTKVDTNGYVTSIYEDGYIFYIKIFVLLLILVCVSIAIIIIIKSTQKANNR